jgi:hypothetical protein
MLGMALTDSLSSASEWFLSRILSYRREFRLVAALSASIEGAFVSWGDVILANIAVTAVSIASCTPGTDGMEGTLARQKEDEAVRAASQLPCELGWVTAYPSLIESRHLA